MINAGTITASISLDTSSLAEGIQKGKRSLKAFAESTLPVIKEHLQMAKATVQQAQAQ